MRRGNMREEAEEAWHGTLWGGSLGQPLSRSEAPKSKTGARANRSAFALEAASPRRAQQTQWTACAARRTTTRFARPHSVQRGAAQCVTHCTARWLGLTRPWTAQLTAD